MQAVLDFLLEYFYWILGVLVVLLITVIGFLADTKKKKKLREKSAGETNNSNGELNNTNMGGMNMNNDFNNMNMGTDNNMMNQNVNVMSETAPVNNVTSDMNMGVNNFNTMPEGNMNNNFNNMTPDMNVGNNNMNVMPELNNMPNMNDNLNNNVSSVNSPIQNNASNDSFFTPASEQTPTFAPRDVTIPTPVEPTPVVNNNVNSVNSWDINANVSPVEAAPVMPTTDGIVPNVPNIGQEQTVNTLNIETNPSVNVSSVAAPVTPVVPEVPAVPEPSVNMNVMPEVTPQVEPVVNPQMINPNVNFGPSVNEMPREQVPPVNTPVTPNFVTGAMPNNMQDNNMNLNG